MVSYSSCVNRSLSLSLLLLDTRAEYRHPLGSFYPIKFIRSNTWIWHQSHIVNRTIYISAFGWCEPFFQRHPFPTMTMCCWFFVQDIEAECVCFHLNCWCLLPRIMSFLWISPVCVLFCCRTEWDMLDEAISLKIKRNVTACVEYVCMSQEEMMCPDVVVPSNMHLWWKFRPDMDSYEYITQTEYANNIVRNNEMTCH